jgi:hypothetical protein
MINYLKYASKGIKWKKYALKTKTQNMHLYAQYNFKTIFVVFFSHSAIFVTVQKNMQMLQVLCSTNN